MASEKRKIQDVIIRSKKTPSFVTQEAVSAVQKAKERRGGDDVNITPFRYQDHSKNNTQTHAPSSSFSLRVLWGIGILLIVILVLVIGGFFSRATVFITKESVVIPLDISTTLTQDNTVPGILFGAIKEDLVASKKIETSEDVLLTKNFLKDALHSERDSLLARMRALVPETKIAVPLVIAEPVFFEERNDSEGRLIIAKQSLAIIVADRTLFAEMIYRNYTPSIQKPVTIETLDDFLVLASIPVSAESLPQNIPVRMTGTVLLERTYDQNGILDALVGQTKKDAKKTLDEIIGQQKHRVHIRPFWRTIFPVHPKSITVIVKD